MSVNGVQFWILFLIGSYRLQLIQEDLTLSKIYHSTEQYTKFS